jgi:DNA-binding GntR family transcriptional regulator
MHHVIMLTMTRPSQTPTARVAADLRRRIDAGEWASGEQMPSTRTISEQYDVSSRTAVKVYRLLADEGLVVITPSWGTHRA